MADATQDYGGRWIQLYNSAYATTATLTFDGTATIASVIIRSLFYCTSSDGNTKRYGYVKSATESSGTVTVTVVASSDLASGDINFAVAPEIKIDYFAYYIFVGGVLTADASNSQGTRWQDMKPPRYLLPVDSAVLTPAAGPGAALTWNIYSDATALFNSDQDMTTNATYNERRPDTNGIDAGKDVTLRIKSITSTGNATDFGVWLYMPLQSLYEYIV